MILLTLWLGSQLGVHGLGIGVLLQIGVVYWADRRLTRREMRRLGPVAWIDGRPA